MSALLLPPRREPTGSVAQLRGLRQPVERRHRHFVETVEPAGEKGRSTTLLLAIDGLRANATRPSSGGRAPPLHRDGGETRGTPFSRLALNLMDWISIGVKPHGLDWDSTRNHVAYGVLQ